MKNLILILGISLLSNQVFAQLVTNECMFLFDRSYDFAAPPEEKEPKPRYFTVKDYDQFKDTELRALVNEFKTFEDYLQNVRLVDDLFEGYVNGSKRAAYRYVANKITPLLDTFLKKLKVNYVMEANRNEENGEIDTHFIILETTNIQKRDGQYTALNTMADNFLSSGRYVTVLNPFDLVRKTQGTARLSDDGVTYYSISLNLFVNVARQNKLFKSEDADFSEDPELADVLNSIKDKTQEKGAPKNFAELLQESSRPANKKGSPGWLPPRFGNTP